MAFSTSEDVLASFAKLGLDSKDVFEHDEVLTCQAQVQDLFYMGSRIRWIREVQGVRELMSAAGRCGGLRCSDSHEEPVLPGQAETALHVHCSA